MAGLERARAKGKKLGRPAAIGQGLQEARSDGCSQIAFRGSEHKRDSETTGDLKILGSILNQRDPEKPGQTQGGIFD